MEKKESRNRNENKERFVFSKWWKKARIGEHNLRNRSILLEQLFAINQTTLLQFRGVSASPSSLRVQLFPAFFFHGMALIMGVSISWQARRWIDKGLAALCHPRHYPNSMDSSSTRSRFNLPIMQRCCGVIW